MTMTIQTAIATIDREVMHDLVTTQFLTHGFSRIIYTTVHKGVPLYLMQCSNGVGYVCTLAQMQYIVRHLANKTNTVFYYKKAPNTFRVYPTIKNLQHNLKGAQYGVVYTSLSKAHNYTGCLPI